MKRYRFRDFPWIVMALLLLIGSCAGCKKHDDGTASPAGASIRVGYIPVTHCLPLYIAIDQGLFAREGLAVELVPLPGGAKILEALAAGEIDVGFSNVVSPILARSQGLPFVAFTGGPVEDRDHKDHAIMVRPDSTIQGVQDLRGKRVAINTRRNIDHLMILLLLKKYGLTENDVTLVEVPFPQMLATLSSNTVDAIATAEPFVTLGQEARSARVLTWNYVDVRPETYVSTYVTREALLSEKSSPLRSFRLGLIAGTAKVREDPVSARAALAKYTKLSPDVAAKVGLPRFESELDRANLAETISEMVATGLLGKQVDVAEVVVKEVP